MNFIEYILVQQKLCASHVLSTGIHARDTIANYTPKPLVDGVCTLSVIKVNPNTRLSSSERPFSVETIRKKPSEHSPQRALPKLTEHSKPGDPNVAALAEDSRKG